MHHLNANSNPSVTIGLAPGHYVTIEGSATVYRIEAGVEPVTLGAVTTIGPYATTASFRIDAAIGDVVVSDPKIYTLNVDNWAAGIGLPTRAEYEGVVNCRYMHPDTLNGAVASQMSERFDFVREDITSFRLLFPNFYATATGEAFAGTDRAINSSVKSPDGMLTQVTFGGSATGIIPAGQPYLLSDVIDLALQRGSKISTRTRQACSSGILISPTTGAYGIGGDQQSIGSNTPDQTMNPAWTGTAGSNPYGPIMIAKTRRPTIMLVGDSRFQGVGHTSNSVPYAGEAMPALAPYFGCINLGRGSLKASDAANAANFAYRSQLFQYVSHVILNLGTIDLAGSAVTAAQVISYRATIRGYAPDKTWLHTTMAPKTTSSDTWATITGQTAESNAAARTTCNDMIRAGVEGFSGFFDVADAVESSRNSTKWKAPPLTDAAITNDGNHCNNAGYALCAKAVRPDMIVGVGI